MMLQVIGGQGRDLLGLDGGNALEEVGAIRRRLDGDRMTSFLVPVIVKTPPTSGAAEDAVERRRRRE